MDKIYVGEGKAKTTQYGDLISVTLELDKLMKEYNNHGFLSLHGRKVKVTVLKKREVGKYGDTHYVTLDTWHPTDYKRPAGITIMDGSAKQEKVEDEKDPVF